MIFRPPVMVADQDRTPNPLVDSRQPDTAHLQALPILHDGEPSTADPEKSLLDEWRDDEDEPELQLQKIGRAHV